MSATSICCDDHGALRRASCPADGRFLHPSLGILHSFPKQEGLIYHKITAFLLQTPGGVFNSGFRLRGNGSAVVLEQGRRGALGAQSGPLHQNEALHSQGWSRGTGGWGRVPTPQRVISRATFLWLMRACELSQESQTLGPRESTVRPGSTSVLDFRPVAGRVTSHAHSCL